MADRSAGRHRVETDLRVAAGLAGSVARLLRRPLSLGEARRDWSAGSPGVRRLLALARHAIYRHPASVYRRLLQHAGCELGDLAGLVRRDGLESALRQLLAQGVHLTVDEAKGRQPVVRGSLTLAPEPDMLTNPLAARHVRVATQREPGRPDRSCSWTWRSSATRASTSLSRSTPRAAGTGSRPPGRSRAAWPSTGILKLSSLGPHVARWFSQVNRASRDLHARYRWSAGRCAGGASRGRPCPAPCTPLSTIRCPSRVGCAASPPRPALPSRILEPGGAACQAALDAGIELAAHASPWPASRSPTPARLVRRRGAVPRRLRHHRDRLDRVGCLAPRRSRRVHVLHDLQRSVAARPAAGSLLFLPPLRRTAPSSCSTSPWATGPRLGRAAAARSSSWAGPPTSTHPELREAHRRRVTFLDADVMRVLEEVLPARSAAGRPTTSSSRRRPTAGAPSFALVHPAVGPLPRGA